MFPPRANLLLVVVPLMCLPPLSAADPPKVEKKVPPLADLIKVLKDGTRAEQVDAAELIRDHYAGKCLEAIPQMAASMGRESNVPVGTPNVPPRSYTLDRTLGEAAQTAGSGRFKVLFELTADKDSYVRAGAFRLLMMASENFQRVYYESKDKSELDLVQLLTACQKGVKDESALVRCQVYVSLHALQGADPKLAESAVLLLADGLEDRKVLGTQAYSPAYQAANSLRWFGAQGKPALKTILKAAASQEESQAAAMSCWVLGGIAKTDKTLAPEIVAAMRVQYMDTKRKWDFRTPAMGVIGDAGRAGEVAVPELAAILDEPTITPFARNGIYHIFRRLGASAEKGVPALVKALQTAKDTPECCEILDTLKEIGPAASEAIKPLEAWMEKASDPRMKQYVKKTIDALK
jgi:hypothetical protein